MDRRLFLTGLLGAAGTAVLATALPRPAGALPSGPLEDPAPATGILPELEAAAEKPAEAEGVQVAWHNGLPHTPSNRGRVRRRRVRRRRWRRTCRRYRNRWGRWVSRCRRRPYYFWIWI